MKTKNEFPPVVIDFVTGSKLNEQRILSVGGREIKLPAEQVVLVQNHRNAVRVGLGGMSFEGVENNHLVFWRVKDVIPEELQECGCEYKMSLDQNHVKEVYVQGKVVWPQKESSR